MLPDWYKHSATAGNTFMADPSAFLWRWGLKNFAESSRMNMGTAAEVAVNNALLHDLDNDAAGKDAEARFDELQKGEIAPEREQVGAITQQFLDKMRPLGKPLTYQAWRVVPGHYYGLERDIKVKTDFGYEWGYLDTKATLRMPSIPSASHVRQQALYAKLLESETRLLYATPKKSEFFPVTPEDVEAGFSHLLMAFRQIERLSTLCPTPEKAIEIIPLNLDSFYWSDEAERNRAIQLWSN